VPHLRGALSRKDASESKAGAYIEVVTNAYGASRLASNLGQAVQTLYKLRIIMSILYAFAPFEIAASRVRNCQLKKSYQLAPGVCDICRADTVMLYASWFTPVAGSAVILAALAGAAALTAWLPRAAARPTS
jgi:hypothetical protein